MGFSFKHEEKRHVHLRPDTSLGRRSLALLGIFVASFSLTVGLVALGVRGFWVPAVIPGFVVIATGISLFVTSVVAIFGRHERSSAIIIAAIIGGLVVLFLLGEFMLDGG